MRNYDYISYDAMMDGKMALSSWTKKKLIGAIVTAYPLEAKTLSKLTLDKFGFIGIMSDAKEYYAEVFESPAKAAEETLFSVGTMLATIPKKAAGYGNLRTLRDRLISFAN